MTDNLITFWNLVVTTFSIFFFLASLIILFLIITDLLRDDELNGFFKAVWIVFLLFVPLITSLVYIVTRGEYMTRRQRARKMKLTTSKHSEKSAIEKISDAKKLWNEGMITESEYKQLKYEALNN